MRLIIVVSIINISMGCVFFFNNFGSEMQLVGLFQICIGVVCLWSVLGNVKTSNMNTYGNKTGITHQI